MITLGVKAMSNSTMPLYLSDFVPEARGSRAFAGPEGQRDGVTIKRFASQLTWIIPRAASPFERFNNKLPATKG